MKRGVRQLLIGALVWATGLGAPGAWAQAALEPNVSVAPGNGYARVQFEWPGEVPVQAQADLSNDVVVVRFSRPVALNANEILRKLDSVAALARLDGDGRALRIALKTPARVHTSQAGRRFALDLVSPQRRTNPEPVIDPQAEKAQGPAPVEMRVAELETMTRLTFAWPGPVKHDAVLKQGELTIRFAAPGTVDLKRFQDRQIGWMKSVRAEERPDGLSVVVSVDPDIRLSDRREGNQIIVDLIEPAQDREAMAANAPDDRLPDPGPSGPTPAPALAVPPPVAAAPAAAVPAVPAPVAAHQAPVALVRSDAEAAAAGLRPGTNASAGPDLRPATGEPAAASSPPPPNAAPGTIAAALRGQSVVIAAGFRALPKAAIFRRGTVLWMVFETAEALDASGLAGVQGAGVSASSQPQFLAPGLLGLRLRADPALPASVAPYETSWVVTIGPDAIHEPSQIAFLREQAQSGASRLKALVRDAGAIAWIRDPDFGDRLALAPLGAPARGLSDGRVMAEFDVLPTLHGFAVKARADDLLVTAESGAIAIARPKGLALSKEVEKTLDLAGPVPDSEYPAADLAGWKRFGDDPANAARILLRASADSPPGMSQQRMALARYYVANDLGAEALGVLRLMASGDPASETVPAFRTLRAIAHLQMQRPEAALTDLNIAALARDPHAAFWRGLAFAGAGKHAEARANLMMAARFFAAYPPAWQARARLALAKSLLGLGDAAEAERAIAATAQPLPRDLAAELAFMRGRVAEATHREDVALAKYAEAMKSGHAPTAVRAELAATLLKARTKAATPSETAEALERLRYRWRGDDIEMATLHALGLQYLAMGKAREGLDALSAAVRNFPDQDGARTIRLDMQKAFAAFFLGPNAADTPALQALALFYDYKDLTPPGLEGDEVIRKLADRLVEVDLLPQAAELLQHQVDKRLDGVARASVASRLALIYLLDRKPEKALGTIRSSRQVRLPDALIAERRLLEARALADLALTDEAIEALEGDDSAPANRLKADIFWSGQRWADAGRASEALAGDAWKQPAALSDLARMDVMRAAVAFVLAGERGGVERLRSRFAAKMADSPDARSFAVVSGGSGSENPDIRSLVRQVASADAMDAFLQDMKARTRASAQPQPLN